MIDEKLIARIDKAIENERKALAADVIRLVNIKSVQGDPIPGAPFGPGPRAVLDKVMDMGRAEGFHATDYGVGVVSLALHEGQPDLGVWLHGDVVPEGEGWTFPPYDAREYKGCIIGRGATDNKGQLCAIFHLMKIFKALDVPLGYNLALYVGSNEETGKHDLTGIPGNPDARGFCNMCTPPRLSLVPDAGFPVGYGGKGRIFVKLRADKPLHGLTIAAGLPGSPGRAEADLNGEHFETFVPPRHAAHPSPDGNGTTMLMDQLLARELDEYDRTVLTFFREVTLDIHGAWLGVDKPSEAMGVSVLSAQEIKMVDGRPEIKVVIRFVDTLTPEEMLAAMGAKAAEYGLSITSSEVTMRPYLLDKNDEKVQVLTKIANEVRGEEKLPFTLSGGTYAHDLPNALVFGMNGCRPPEDFPKGKGGAHGLDESVSLDRLQTAMRIYARALLTLDGMDW